MWLPELASVEGAAIDDVIELIHWFMLILFVGWGVFYTAALIRFRAGKNPKANYYGVTNHSSTYVEAGVVIFEAVLLLGFAIPMWGRWLGDLPDPKDATVVRAIGQQFAWNIHYPGPDGVFGKTDVKLVDAQTNPLGLDKKDQGAKDDVVTQNHMHVPVNKPVLVYVGSKDVIHSFKVPVMRITQDAVPGTIIPISFTPNRIINAEIACAQLCGVGHAKMRGFLKVESQRDFEEWMAKEVQSAQEAAEAEDW